MGTCRLRSSRGLVGVVVWTLLATATALEVYVDASASLDPDTYQDDNSLDTGPDLPDTSPDLALAKDVLLYKLIKAFQGRESPTARYRPDWPSEYQPRRPRQLREPRHINHHKTLVSEQDTVVKRYRNVMRGSGTNIGFKGLDLYRPQQKWKIKKGKALGSQMVCYFKLCAFRSPL